jgi:hypothetical protein
MPSSTTAIIPLFQAASVFMRQLLGSLAILLIGSLFATYGALLAFRPDLFFTLPFFEPISCGVFVDDQKHPDARASNANFSS